MEHINQLRWFTKNGMIYISGWWFGTCFIFPYIGNNHPNWLIFFRGVQTTNQMYIYIYIHTYIYIRIILMDIKRFLQGGQPAEIEGFNFNWHRGMTCPGFLSVRWCWMNRCNWGAGWPSWSKKGWDLRWFKMNHDSQWNTGWWFGCHFLFSHVLGF